MRRLTTLLLLAPTLLSVALSACGDDRHDREAHDTTTTDSDWQRRGYSVVTVENGGTIVGRVVAAGRRPEMPPLAVPPGLTACNPASLEQPLATGKHGELPGVVVYIDSISAGKEWPRLDAAARTIDQQGCVYRPRRFAIPVGDQILFRNSDPLSHNVRVESGRDIVMNVAQAHAQLVDTLTTTKPGPLTVVCDYHPWMFAAIYVTPNPYYSITTTDGMFRIDNVPPGDYVVTAWFADPVARAVTDERGNLVRYTYGKPYVLSSRVTVVAGEQARVPFTIVWR